MEHFTLDLSNNKLGKYSEGVKYLLGKGLKGLPNSLKDLFLYLPDNGLGENIKSIKYLVQGVK